MDIGLFLYSFLLGSGGAWVAIRFAARFGLNDIPNQRSSHTRIIPKGGGIGILTAFILASLTLDISASLWLPSLVISLASLWGADKQRLSVKEKLLIQFGCSIVFLIFFFYSKQVALSTYLFIVPMSIFVVGTSNFYNFMDGIDGIAGITGVVGFSLLFFYNNGSGIEDGYSTLCLVLVFSCLGFLCFNIPKARVFIGDIGSILLGFVFACVVIILSGNIIDFIVMVGFLAPFYFDELFTMVIRIKNRDSLVMPHRKHIYQLLVNEFGIRHWKVSLVYGVAQMMIGVSVIFIMSKGLFFILLVYLTYSIMFAVASIIIRKKVSIK